MQASSGICEWLLLFAKNILIGSSYAIATYQRIVLRYIFMIFVLI